MNSPSPAPQSAVTFVCECATPDGSDVARRLYRVTDHEGGVSHAIYCDDCAALARADWNGTTAACVTVSCDCEGCLRGGLGTCGCLTCSECGDEGAVVLETLDVKDGEDGPRPFRPCASCLGMPARDVDAVLSIALAADFAAAGAS